MKTVGIHTLGCKVNTYESEYIINELQKNGYEVKDFEDICDVYIINTCTVTNNSDSKSRKMIRQAIKRNPKASISITNRLVLRLRLKNIYKPAAITDIIPVISMVR